MPKKSQTASVRSRRLTFTMVVYDETDAIERKLVEAYDDLPTTGHRRQDFLRRTLLAGMSLQILAEQPDQSQRLLQQLRSVVPLMKS